MKKILASLLAIAILVLGAVQAIPVLEHVSEVIVIADDPVPPPEPPPNDSSFVTGVLTTENRRSLV